MDRHRPFLGTVASFREAFPRVKTLRLVGRQRGDASGEYQREEHYTESNVPQVIRCSNPRCQQGGYDLMPYMLSISPDNPNYEGEIYCSGHEGTPKGRRKGDPCWNRLTFSIAATFNEAKE